MLHINSLYHFSSRTLHNYIVMLKYWYENLSNIIQIQRCKTSIP